MKPMASYKIRAEAITSAPPERVFAVLDDFGRWPRWMPYFQHLRVELPSGETPRLGYRFRLHAGVIHTDLEVIDYTPFTRATRFRISFPPFSGVNRCRVLPLANGQYRIERIDSLDVPELVAGVLDATQRRKFDRMATDFLNALKVAVEA